MRRETCWVYILSFSVMSCYSTRTIDPRGEHREIMYSKDIRKLVTFDDKEYVFEDSPTIVADSLVVGTIEGEEVTIALSAVRTVYVEQFDSGKTVALIQVTTAVIVAVVAIVSLMHPL